MNRNAWWLVGTLLGWAVFAVGWTADSGALLLVSAALFAVLLVERLDNMRRQRKARVTR